MSVFALAVSAAFFAWLGRLAMLRPGRLLAGFGVVVETADGRNEIRAVYGGFPFALSATLIAAIVVESIRAGVLLTAAAALAGMVAGRLISALLDRSFGRFPKVFAAMEAVLATLLIGAAFADGML